MERRADVTVLVVDAQFDSYSARSTDPDGSADHPALEAIDLLLGAARNASIDICFTRHLEDPAIAPANLRALFESDARPSFGSFRPGSEGARLAIGPRPGELVFDKTTWSAFGNEQFGAHLHSTGRRILVVCGFQTEVCVFATVSSAFERGYTVVIPREAVGTRIDQKAIEHEFALKLMEEYFAFVVPVERMCRDLFGSGDAAIR